MLVSEHEDRWIAPSSPDHPLAYTVLILASCFVPAWLHAQWQALRREMSENQTDQTDALGVPGDLIGKAYFRPGGVEGRKASADPNVEWLRDRAAREMDGSNPGHVVT
jgi:hypothetical protein